MKQPFVRLALAFMVGIAAIAVAIPTHAYKREKQYKEPNLPPGIVHSAPCKQLAPGVYDCGNRRNHNRSVNKKTGRWKVTIKPTDDIVITAKSKAEREAEKNSR